MSGNPISSLDRAKADLAALITSAQENIQATQMIEVPAPDASTELHPSTDLSGPEKRVADAQAAQRNMSKAGNALDQKLARASEIASTLEAMADRLARMSEPQPASFDKESLTKAVHDLMELEGGAVFGPVFDAVNRNVQELANGLEDLRQTVTGLINAQRESLPAVIPNADYLFTTYGKETIDAMAVGGPFDTYLSLQSSAYRATLEEMFSNVNRAERADLVIEMNRFVAWLKTQAPGKKPDAAAPGAAPVPTVPALTPGAPDSIPASAMIAGSSAAPSGGGNHKLLSQAEFDGFAMLMARAKSPAEKASLQARYAATVEAMRTQP